MKTALIYPPSADPTAPYLSVPMLTGYLRAKGLEVMPVDANIEAYDQLLRKSTLISMVKKAVSRLAGLEKKASLSHTDQLSYIRLCRSKQLMRNLPEKIDDAVAVMRGKGDRFYDPIAYETALLTINDGLALISAAFSPVALDFCYYNTPFSLLNINEIQKDAKAQRNPFYDYFENTLAPRLSQGKIDIVGISMAFPSQIQSAYTLAFIVRRLFPDMCIVAGGPAITQVFVKLNAHEAANALGPFDSVVLFEGEETLYTIISDMKKGIKPQGIIQGKMSEKLETLPAPDFDGMPLDLYFSPEPVLPYDPARGCYWGKCAFCHYGLSKTGTAHYRERPIQHVSDHLDHLADKHRCRIFYFSQDTLSPKTALKLATAFRDSGATFRFGSDIRPEPHLTKEWAKAMAAGGALSFALGIESGSKRILAKINKGVKIEDMQAAVANLAGAGIAAECMCFTHFPTETYPEALATLEFLNKLNDKIALFMCGEFGLDSGAGIALDPDHYGLSDMWHVTGDEFIKTLFFLEKKPSKSMDECENLDDAVNDLSRSYWFHAYPWAGSLSTAHSLLWYDHYGPDVFRRFAHIRAPYHAGELKRKNDIQTMEGKAQYNEGRIWQILVYEKRIVSAKDYKTLAESLPHVGIPGKGRKKHG
ncbi:MAG: radical SAM protein [Proteobacteria bacterium]|nr:radical SAM protein [Pseudomonadota bacterium]